MNLQYNHAKIKVKSRNFEQLQRFSRKSEKIRANFMKISKNHDEICKKILVGKLLTRSTRSTKSTCFCTAQTSIFQQISTIEMLKSSIKSFSSIFVVILLIFMKFAQIFSDIELIFSKMRKNTTTTRNLSISI